MLQKTFTVDFLQKKKKANEGEVPQYYVENSHPAIVTEEMFDLVQHELRRRQEQGRHTSAVSIFSSRIVCGECGAYYGSKVWHSTDAYRSQIWRCNRKYETKGSPCPSPHIREEELKSAFVKTICRVSSGKDAMLHSLSAQVSHYSTYIQKHPGWEYAGVYADEACTGTKDTRPQFQCLLEECRAKRIDRILTKSVSRFARNTVTLLETVRELRTLGVAVYFEEQNIDSLREDGELMLTILASFAQAESKSVSDNCKWRIRKSSRCMRKE